MGYAEVDRRGNAGQLDRTITVKRYNVTLNQYDESQATLLTTEEVWAKRQGEGATVDFSADATEAYDLGSWIVRYDPRYLDDHAITLTVDGVTKLVGTVEVIGRRQFMVLSD